MVLYKRKPIALSEPKALPLDLNIDVWHIDETGEWFITYEEYLERLDFYGRHHFTCEITGTSCLTFFEALDSEESQFKYVEEKFPLKLREPVARFLHFNGIKRLDALVEKVYARFKSDFFPGETVYLRKNNKETSAPPSHQSTPQPGDVVFKSVQKENVIESSQPQYQRPYIIKEKAQFNATKDPDTGEIIMPAYSKYMIIEESHGHKSLIADQSQLYRDRSTFTKHLIKCFCKITLKRASTKMGAPWAVKDEYLPMYGLTMEWPLDMLKYKDDETAVKQEAARNKRNRSGEEMEDGQEDDETLRMDEQDTENRNSKDEEDDSQPVPKKKKIVEEAKEDSTIQENISNATVTSIVEDLALPYQGSPHVFENLFHYNELLECVPVDGSASFKPFRAMDKLLQVFQFLNTFGPKIYLSYFDLDQFITSLKCTDPTELKGEVVYVEFIVDKKDGDGKTEQLSDWQRNQEFRTMINKRNTDEVLYSIVKDEPATDDVIDNINQNGTGLLIETFTALLRLFITENGDWSSLVVEEWLKNDENYEIEEENRVNDNREQRDVHEKESKSESESENEADNVDTNLEKCLNYRNVNWAERLSKRQFNNGYWLIILLGIFQDCMHIPIYTEIIREFNKKVIPSNVSASQLPKQLWRNFCNNLSLMEKLNTIWILVDLISNFSPDIKTAVEESMELCGQIRSERFRVAKDLKAETSSLNLLILHLQVLEQAATKDENEIQERQTQLMEQQLKVDNLQKDKSFLDKKLVENDSQRLKSLGVDRYGNRYYWLDLSGVPIQDFPESTGDHHPEGLAYHSGRLWIQGPSAAAVKFFLKISDEELSTWLSLAEEKNSTYATKEVFHIYRADDGSYKHVGGDSETELVNSSGILNSLIELTPIQKKIIDESPECILLSDQQWYSIDRMDDLNRLLDWLDTWGRREHDLLRQFKNIESNLQSAYTIREKLLCLSISDDVEVKLLNDLKENEFSASELEFNDRIDNGNIGGSEQEESEDEEELEAVATEIMKLDDCSKTRKILNKIKELEDRRDSLLEKRQAMQNAKRPGGRVQARAERRRLQNLRENKLEKQMEILTDLLNHRHFKSMEDVIKWKNQLAIKVWGSSLRKNATGNKKVDVIDTVDAKLQEIMDQTSRVTTATTAY